MIFFAVSIFFIIVLLIFFYLFFGKIEDEKGIYLKKNLPGQKLLKVREKAGLFKNVDNRITESRRNLE